MQTCNIEMRGKLMCAMKLCADGHGLHASTESGGGTYTLNLVAKPWSTGPRPCPTPSVRPEASAFHR